MSYIKKSFLFGITIYAYCTIAFPVLSAETLKIGVLMPTSGSGAAYGIPAINGIILATNEINKNGGLIGKKVEFVIRDTKLKPSVASAAAKELITKEKVQVLLGAISSSVTLAVSEVAKNEKIVLFAPISKTTALTGKKFHKYIFQSSANTIIEGRAMATIAKKIGARKICVSGFDYAYSHDLFESLEQKLVGPTISAKYHVKFGTKDFSALISQLLSAECDTVVGAIWGGGFLAFVKQANPFGLFKQKKFIWGAEVGSHEMANSLKGDYPEGIWANSYDLWYHKGPPAHKKFQQALAKLEGQKETNMWPITTYVGIKFLAAGITKAGTSESEKLVEALEGLSIDTPLGRKTIDPENHRVNTGEFWGPMKKVGDSSILHMSPPTYFD